MRKSTSIVGALALSTSLLFPVVAATSGAGADSAFAYSIKSMEKDSCELVKIDLATAAVTDLSAAPLEGACVADLTVAPDGTPWGIKMVDGSGPKGEANPQAGPPLPDIELVEFDPSTGSIVGRVGLSINGNGQGWLAGGGIAIAADGTVYAQLVSDECDEGSTVCLVTVDPASGAATAIGPSGEGEAYYWFLADCDGLVTYNFDDGDELVSVSKADGSTSVLGATGTLNGFDCAGDQRFALELPLDGPKGTSAPQVSGGSLVTFDPVTGATAFVAAIDPDVELATLAIPPAPKPPTTTPSVAPTTASTVPAVQSVTAQPKFTG